MYDNIDFFVSKIDGFSKLNASVQIKYFVYFLQIEKKFVDVNAKHVLKCFEILHLNPYSNILSFLSSGSKKGKSQKFLKKGEGYVLLSNVRKEIDSELQKPVDIKPSNDLFDNSIFDATKNYLVKYANEANVCYSFGLYDSCLFMLRKVTETLIIEMYESKGIEARIKTHDNDYFHLSTLIKTLIADNTWKLTKIVKESLPKIKLLADSSVHSKRFNANKYDIDGLKLNIRIAFEELISHINYPLWNSKT